MEIIPVVQIFNNKYYENSGLSKISLDNILQKIDENKDIYFYDKDGILKDKPNLCTYQKLSGKRNVWSDSGPRVFGDVVDLVMSGVNNIVIRKKLFKDFNISSIREITENKIFLLEDLNDGSFSEKNFSTMDVDGIVIFANNNNINYYLTNTLKKMIIQYNTYVYETNTKNFTYWENAGVVGILTDLNKKI